ncbi:MAG: S-adenosylmethionine:tRNA ribosyltransferase-isomerase, partial [Clostridia bacterium]|nr:S-adenosylmethionine:tRNA ribosyltransferase-isomerase [Clostridia bacterium]
MKKSDFFYHLPKELIAQHPCEQRDNSALMVLNRATGEITHEHFYDLPKYLNPGDCLIINDTKVLPARIYGTKIPTGAIVEFLLLKQLTDGTWECLAGPGKKAKPGDRFSFG